jgi:CP family cyanate transporter-like MFS transporter
MGLQSAAFFATITWLPSIQVASGTSAQQAGVNVMIANGFSVLGNLAVIGLIRGTRGHTVTVLCGSVPMTAGVVGQWAFPGAGSLWAAAIGFGAGVCIAFALSLFGLRATDSATATARSGMAQGAGYLVAAAAPPLIGALHDITHAWTAGLIALGVLTLAQLSSGILAARPGVIGDRPEAS